MALGVPEFRRALIQLGGALDGDIGKLVAAIGGLDVPAAMRLVTDAYPELSSPYLAAAADLTATWYEDQPTAATEAFIAEPAALPDVEQLAINARWALTQKEPATALLGAGRRALFQQHRDTVILNTEREGVAWAREARPGACGFCRMQATRILTEGFGGAPGLYRTQATAEKNFHTVGAEGHDHCRCIAVPMRRGQSYTIPGYVHGWLDDYEAVSRDESGRLLPVARIVAAMEHRGAERGDPVTVDPLGGQDAGRAKPTVIDLDAGTRAPASTRGPAGEPLALPAGQSSGRLAIEAPKAQKINRPPIALGTGRAPKMLTAAPARLAIEAPKVPNPDPGAVAEWLQANDDHWSALEAWRALDRAPLPPAEAIVDTPPAEPQTIGDQLRAVLAAAIVDQDQPDDRKSATAKQKQQRRDARRLAVRNAQAELDAAIANGTADDPIPRKRAKARPLAEVDAELRAQHDATMVDVIAAFEEACGTGDDALIEAAADRMESIEAAEQARREKVDAQLAKIADKSQKQRERREAERDADFAEMGRLAEEEGYTDEQAEATVVAKRTGKTEQEVLVQIRKREFMRECASDGITGGSFEDVLDRKFRLTVELLYMEAENATNGYMVKKPHKLDPKKLWSCNDATARKVMSEEMALWFDQNGRMTKPVMREMVLSGENFARLTVMDADYLE